VPAGDLDDLAGQPARLVRGQKDDDVGDIRGRPRSPEGYIGQYFFHPFALDLTGQFQGAFFASKAIIFRLERLFDLNLPAAALTKVNKGELLTGDREFEKLETDIRIVWI
jgi:hypothetical protein